ncbi:MAG: TonB-dependent receptor plug domain-containing protein [Phenylobacterium sp.]|uniref:TonB-dependent receptor plug domain-containing protein n=1 Tax=Phenylobacterium sp. TaxID=1871053 RepID=UPI0025DDD708|nr:TonB-dependent receptor [Phenylobacterium sp.]MBI1197663.1 TonB-dependent receptor plug domain-containing protein [Phenylobacterium sp.]
MKTRLLLFAAAAAIAPAHSACAESAVDEVVVTASRNGEGLRADQIGGSATVLDDTAFEQRQTRFVSDILRDAPGLAVNRVAGLTQIRIRGAEANHTLALVDGIEVSDPYAGEFDFGALIADEGVKVEVLRGQQSALYGSDAIGGVINYITLSGAEAPGVRLRAEGGSFGTVASAARAAGVVGDLDYAVSASQFRTDGAPNARGGERDIGSANWSLSGKTRWSPSETFRLDLVGRYSRSRDDINNSDFDPTSASFGYTVDSPGSYVKNHTLYGLARGELSLLDGRWTQAISAQAAYTKRDGFDFDAPSYGDRGRRTKASYETTYRFGTGAIRQEVTLAVDAERERARNADPSGFAFNGWRHIDNVGVVAAYDLWANDRLALGASFRHDDNNRFRNADTYRVQGSYRFDSGLRLRAAAGSGVKNPGFGELFGYVDGRYIGNPDLRPETSEGWEAGAEQTFMDGAALIGATWFHSTLKDEIYTTFPPPLFVASPANRDTKSKQRGLEAFARVRFGAFLIDAAYTRLHARENGQVEVRRPNDIASLALTWQDPGDRGSATLVVRYNGAQDDLAFTDPSFVPVRVRLDDYTLVDLNGEWRLTDRVRAFARVENLFDARYEEVFSFVAPGRGVYAGLRTSF